MRWQAAAKVLIAVVGLVGAALAASAQPPAAVAQTVPPQAGVDCNCTAAGPYVEPAEGRTIASGDDGTSPQGVYQVTATGGGGSPTDLTVKRVATGATVLSLSGLPATTRWGFSPDDQRFLYHNTTGTGGSLHTVALYDLAISPARQVWTTAVTTGNARITFSPHGRYLVYTWLSGPAVANLSVIDAVSGATRYQD